MRGLSSAASCWQSFSASGSFIEILLQYELCGDGIDRLFLQAPQLRFRFNGGVALVHSLDGKLEAPLQAAREVLGVARHLVRLALRRGRQPDHQRCRLPFLYQKLDVPELGNGGQGMRGAELRLSHCNANTLEAEVEGEDGAPLRHVPLRPAASRSRAPAAPSPPAGAPRPGSRR